MGLSNSDMEKSEATTKNRKTKIPEVNPLKDKGENAY